MKIPCSNLILVVLSSAVMASLGMPPGSEIAKQGCEAECGGVQIPFPFGVGEGCYFDYGHSGTYEIICNHSIPLLFPYGYKSGLQVLSINLHNHTISFSSGVAFDCNNNSSNTSINNNSTNTYILPGLYPFSISPTKNELFGFGCTTNARVEQQHSTDEVYMGDGCTTEYCYNWFHYDVLPSCETSISVFDSISVSLAVSVSNGYEGGCSYAFMGEHGSETFPTNNVNVSVQDCENMTVSVAYDWPVIATDNCIDIGSSALLCGSNTECVDVKSGYHCRCLQGYTGNPYLPHGCQDINECADKRLNECEIQDHCVNKNGGYNCGCKEEYHGNGTLSNSCAPAAGSAKLIVGLAIGMGSTISFILLYVSYHLYKRRKHNQERQHNFKKNGGLLLQQEMSANEGVIDRTKIFTQTDLARATNCFNNTRVLGHGGQGTVYKGMLAEGTIVAVKKSKKVDANHVAQFINEVVILSQINHRNIVKLFGCCLETEVPLLVYEFVTNGTLYQYIHHSNDDFHMTWEVRFQIAMECAEAIAYLHSSCSSPIHHRDIKSSNILLDDNYNAKISDFGTSKSISIDLTHVTTRVQGTFGYLDPEFFRSSQFSEKSDVYSFGVVLLELLTSKKPVYTDSSGETKSLATDFLKVMETGSPSEQLYGIVDPQVLERCSEEEIGALAKLIKQCLSLNGKRRPTMKEVAKTLEMIKSQHGEVRVSDPTLEHQGIIGSCNSHEMNITDDSSFSLDVQLLSSDSD